MILTTMPGFPEGLANGSGGGLSRLTPSHSAELTRRFDNVLTRLLS